jgi:cyclopropane fatty-acyl-phospholipid synthase-like methyltransferase
MDRHKFSAIAHRSHTFCSPVSEAKFDQVVDLVGLKAGDAVVDFGCGNAAMLLRLATRFGVAAEGVELSPQMAQMAKDRVMGSEVRIHECTATEFQGPVAGYALAMAVGAGGLFDESSVEGALQGLARFVKPGGYVLFGDVYWRQSPPQAYLDFLDIEPGEYLDHAGIVRAGQSAGLIPFQAVTSTEDEWDSYEWRYSRSIEQHILEQPQDPDNDAMRARIGAWRDMYLAEGRSTLGFGLYLFHKPPQ